MEAPAPHDAPRTHTDERQAERDALVTQLASRGDIRDPNVLAALAAVPREHFVSDPWAHAAYYDAALPIDCDQTISQPYIVALMSQLVRPGPGRRFLEVGTGSGYQAAVLAATGAEVFSVEILPELAHQAQARLSELGLRVHTRVGDGYEGWPEEAPFDGILVTAAPPEVPAGLVAQLAPGGVLVIPVGGPGEQELWRFTREGPGGGVRGERVAAVRFVPMTGKPGASFVVGSRSGTMRHGPDRD